MPPLRTSLIANYAGQGWTAAMNILFIPLYIRFLGIESYGLVGTFAIVLGAATLFDAGMTPTLNREMARFRAGERDAPGTRDLVRSIEFLCLGIVALLAVVAVIAAPWVATHGLGANRLDPVAVRHALALMVIAASLRMVEGVYRGALLGLGHPVLMNAITAGGATLRAGGAALVLMLVAPRIELFFLWQAGASLLTVLALTLATHRALPVIGRRARFDTGVLREVRDFARTIIATSLLSLLLTQADKVILVRLLPLRDFAFYSVATTVTGGLYQLVGPISQSYYPRLCAAAARDAVAELSRLYHQGAQVVTLVIVPAALALIFFGRPILLLWTHDPAFVERTYPLVRLLAVGTLMHTMMFIPYMLQLACGWPGLAVRVNLVAVAVLVPALLLLVPIYGAVAAAGVWIALNTGYMVYTVRATHTRLLPGEAGRWYVADVGRPLAAGLALALVLTWLPWGGYGRVGDLGMLVVTGVLMLSSVALGLGWVRERLRRRVMA